MTFWENLNWNWWTGLATHNWSKNLSTIENPWKWRHFPKRNTGSSGENRQTKPWILGYIKLNYTVLFQKWNWGKDCLMMFLVNLYSTGTKNCGILNCQSWSWQKDRSRKKPPNKKQIQAVNLVSELFTQICNHGLEVILDRGSWVKKTMWIRIVEPGYCKYD